MKSGFYGNPDRLAHRGDKGWNNADRDDDVKTEKREANPPRGSVGSNDPALRSDGKGK